MDKPGADRTGKPYIAILLGNAAQRARVASALLSFYRFDEYNGISQATVGCRAHLPRLILVSEELAGSSGYDFVRMLRLDPNLATVPVLMMVANDDKPTRDRVAQSGAEGHLANSCSDTALITGIAGLLNNRVERKWKTLRPLQRRALIGTLELFNGVADRIGEGKPIPYRTVSEACGPLVEAIANDEFKGILHGVRDHDNYSYAHSMRVATYLALFGFNLHLPRDEQIILASGGLLHDVGKLAIPHEVLNKAGPLNEAEWAVMKGHVTASVAYLRSCPDLPRGILTIAAQHHEKLDGTGYPAGLAGTQLNRLARMASIIDVFTALTDRRVYKAPMEAETALKFMSDEMAAHLDVGLLGLFRQMLLDATTQAPRELAEAG